MLGIVSNPLHPLVAENQNLSTVDLFLHNNGTMNKTQINRIDAPKDIHIGFRSTKRR